MSYIVPEKMPMRCFECKEISSSTIDGYSCSIAHKSLASEHGINVRRPDWCPLVEIPTPHGRLINADKLMMSLADWWYSSFGQTETEESKAIKTVLDKIENSIDLFAVAEGAEHDS